MGSTEQHTATEGPSASLAPPQNNEIVTAVEKEEEIRIEVPHVRQKYNWDCGVACIQMVLGLHAGVPNDPCAASGFDSNNGSVSNSNSVPSYGSVPGSNCNPGSNSNPSPSPSPNAGNDPSPVPVAGTSFAPDAEFRDVCRRLGFGDSVWTIDLAYILRHYRVRHALCTVTFGVDRGYSSARFYRERFSADELRVNALFQQAAGLGVVAQKRSVALDEILAHLRKRCVVVALVDWRHLDCDWCGGGVGGRCLGGVSACLGKCLGGCGGGSGGAYQGHFIVVVGFNSSQRVIYYKNPSYSIGLCCCSWETFDAARKSYGTDEDLLFVYERESGDHELSNMPQMDRGDS
jgi:hypothetical protein